MSKNLENEYRQHMNTEIPDIWARIESALPEKNNDSTENLVEFSNRSNVKNIVKKKKSKAKVISIASGILVACAAAVLILPAVINGNLSKDEAASIEESSEKTSHKKDKADKKHSKKDKNSVEAIMADDSNFFDAFVDSDYASDSAGAAMNTVAESAACEEEMCDEASDSDNVQNSVNVEKTDYIASVKAECYFIRQYDANGEVNFDNKGLTKSIKEIKKNGDICITIDDIKTAEAIAYVNDMNITEYAVNIQFKDADVWREITEEAAKNGEAIAIYYNGKIISSPRVVAAITDGNAQITGLESKEEAESIAEAVRR